MACIANPRASVKREGEPSISVHRTQHNVRLVKRDQGVPGVMQYKTTAAFFVLLELVTPLVDLLADTRIGINKAEPSGKPLWWVEVLHAEDDNPTLPSDRVVGPLSFTGVFFLELKGKTLRFEVFLEKNLAICAESSRHLIFPAFASGASLCLDGESSKNSSTRPRISTALFDS